MRCFVACITINIESVNNYIKSQGVIRLQIFLLSTILLKIPVGKYLKSLAPREGDVLRRPLRVQKWCYVQMLPIAWLMRILAMVLKAFLEQSKTGARCNR